MSEAYTNIKRGRFSLKDAETITQVKLLEQTPTLSWESSDANRATRQAALAVGEDASTSAFLLARARIAEKMIIAKNPTVKPIALRFTPPAWINAALIALAFVCGLLTDQLASEHSRINLLSLPFFGVLRYALCLRSQASPLQRLFGHAHHFGHFGQNADHQTTPHRKINQTFD